MIWFVLAVLSAFVAVPVPIFAEIGLAEVDCSVATAVRIIVTMIVIAAFVISNGKESQLTQPTSKAVGSTILSSIAAALLLAVYSA